MPDVDAGFDVTQLAYAMDDGRELRLLFTGMRPYRLQAAFLISPSTGKQESLF